MKGLLIKDYYTLTRQLKIYLVILILFAIVGYSMSAFAIFFASMLPVTALAYDERSKWNALAAMMPYSAGSLVFSKYILGYIAVFVATVLSAAAQISFNAVKGTAPEEGAGLVLLVLVCLSLIMMSVNLPFIFRMGVEKGRILFFVIVIAMVVAGMTAADKLLVLLPDTGGVTTGAGIILAFVGLTIAVNLISVVVSIRFYTKKTA